MIYINNIIIFKKGVFCVDMHILSIKFNFKCILKMNMKVLNFIKFFNQKVLYLIRNIKIIINFHI